MTSIFKAVLAAAFAAIVVSGVHAGETFDRVKQGGTLYIGFANEAPYAYRAPSGDIQGVVYEVGKIIFEKIGVKQFDGVIVKFGSLIPGLNAKRFDVVVAGMAVRPDRCKQVSFSEPDMMFGDTLLVPVGNPKGLHSFDDVIQKRAKIAILQGGAASKDVRIIGVPNDQINEFPDFSETVGSLKAKRVDATMMTATAAAKTVMEDEGKNFEVARPFKTMVLNGKPNVHFSAYGFRQEDGDLVEAFNKEFLRFRGSPEHLAILKKYGLSGNELPEQGVSTTSLCGS